MPMNIQRFRRAFSMLELIFVIVIMGIIGKFGTEFLAQAYKNFISSSINNKLQSDSLSAVEFVSARLQHRIKASMIAREDNNTFTLLSEYDGQTANILEWIGSDEEGFRGDTTSYWSGILDLNSTLTNQAQLYSIATDTAKVNSMIQVLSNGVSTINDAAVYFVNPDSLDTHWGWDWSSVVTKPKFVTQLGNAGDENAIHPINLGVTNTFLPVDSDGNANNFSGVDAFEYYQLAWTAYAVGIDDYNNTTHTGNLTLWYNYQPWKGENRTAGISSVIMENVSTFRFIARESLIKIQVCVKSDIVDGDNDAGGYSLCKEKTIF